MGKLQAVLDDVQKYYYFKESHTMTNTVTSKNTENTKESKVIRFPASSAGKNPTFTVIDMKTAKETLERVIQEKARGGNMIDFDVFMECFWPERPEWKGRGLALLRVIKACLFWEKTLYNRIDYDNGSVSGYNYQYQQLLAVNDQEQCRINMQMYLMKSVRAACALNAELKNNIGKYFITRKIKRSDEIGPYNFDYEDSLKMVHDFEESFDDNWGGGSSLMDIRWDLRLEEHNAEMAGLATAA